jgi:two-component system, LuxR family, response regulator FixJ
MHTQVHLIEDNTLLAESLCEVLNLEGLTVEHYVSPGDFLNRSLLANPCCIVTDYRMPEMNGFELFCEYRARGGWQPMLMMTAFAEIPLCTQALEAGMFAYLVKPFEAFLLLEKVTAAYYKSCTEFAAEQRKLALKTAFASLTPREVDVCERILAGRSLKEIAFSLGTTMQTVSKQRMSLWSKLEVGSDIELVKLIMNWDLRSTYNATNL